MVHTACKSFGVPDLRFDSAPQLSRLISPETDALSLE